MLIQFTTTGLQCYQCWRRQSRSMANDLHAAAPQPVASWAIPPHPCAYVPRIILESRWLWHVWWIAVAPWFSPGKFGGGAYLTVDENVGSLIDWVSTDSNINAAWVNVLVLQYNVQVTTKRQNKCKHPWLTFWFLVRYSSTTVSVHQLVRIFY